MAPADNWLSFSLSPLEMLRSRESQMLSTKLMPYYETSGEPSQHHYFFEPFDGNDWPNGPNLKVQIPYTEEIKAVDATDLAIPESFNPQIHQTVPKLEDFLGGHSSSLARYSDRQTETQESSLGNVYEQGSSLFTEQEHLKTIAVTAGFQSSFSANSGSEVEDSVSMYGNRLSFGDFPGHSIESGSELAFSESPRSLSLAVTQSSKKAIVSGDAESSKKINDTFGQRTSVYRGVTKHRWTGRYEAHLWDNSCRREGQSRKGRQVYLGGYDKEEKAARAYDLAALKYWGPTAMTNFPVSSYSKEMEEMKNMSRQEFIASLRRKSSGFSRGASIYRGVTRHHQQGRWQARIGRVAGNKDLYLGTFGTEEEAAEAYDIAAIKFRGVNAVTNFEMSRYDVEAIANSTLPIGGAAKRLKLSLETSLADTSDPHGDRQPQCCSSGSSSTPTTTTYAAAAAVAVGIVPAAMSCGGMPLGTQTAMFYHNLLHQLHSNKGSPSESSLTSSIGAPTGFLPPSSEFYGRSFLYGLTSPINVNTEFNVAGDSNPAIVNQQPWNVASSSN